jgi:hypothetical protein
MTDYDLAHCRRRLVEYEATKGTPGFEEKKLDAMRDGCWRRDGLLRPDLKADAAKTLQEMIDREDPELWR